MARVPSLGSLRRRGEATAGSLAFVCNICSAPNVVERAAIGREVKTCSACGSILRWRSIVAALSISLYGLSAPLGECLPDKGVRGLGMSDWGGYAGRLAALFSYTNTFYDEDPVFDVMAPVPERDAGTFDFVISSDVLEHVAPPYEQALANLRTLLKPGGVLILSVPMTMDPHTVEHYPDLYRYDIAKPDDEYVLVNRTRDGRLQVFEDLVFHEGPGTTLEVRVFSLPELLDRLRATGFEDVGVFDTVDEEHGIIWNDPCNWPIVARAPR
jgi:SAM-dependent methyltransferase